MRREKKKVDEFIRFVLSFFQSFLLRENFSIRWLVVDDCCLKRESSAIATAGKKKSPCPKTIITRRRDPTRSR
jgi:hypothetical protein